MAPKKKTVTTPKPIRDLSSPSAGSQQRVVVVSPTSSALSDGSLSPPHHPATSTKLVASSSSDSNNKAGSQGASALATSMGLIESNHLESSTGKRARNYTEHTNWFREHISTTYQNMFGEALDDELPLEDCMSLLVSYANIPYTDQADFKNRMAALEMLFRKEVDAPIPDSSGINNIKSKGYSLLMSQSYIISQMLIKIYIQLKQVPWLNHLKV